MKLLEVFNNVEQQIFIYKLITAMIDEKVIFVDKNNFGKLTLLKDNLP